VSSSYASDSLRFHFPLRLLCFMLAVCVISEPQENDESKGGIAYEKEDRSSWYVRQRCVLLP